MPASKLNFVMNQNSNRDCIHEFFGLRADIAACQNLLFVYTFLVSRVNDVENPRVEEKSILIH